MIRRLLDWLCGVTLERKRLPGQSCETCCHFIDYRDPQDDPEECNGYCAQLVDTLGFKKALKINPYGGRWTHHESWCVSWEGGPKIWQSGDEAQSGEPPEAVEPSKPT